MNRIASVFGMHTRSTRSKFVWFVLPWAAVVLSLAVNILISHLVANTGGMYTGGLATLYIWVLILGWLVVQDTFPFALGFGLRRTDYVLGSLAMVAALCAGFSVLLVALSGIEVATDGWGVNLHYFNLPYYSEGSAISQFWTYFALLLFVTLLGFVGASISARFGRIGAMVAFGTLGVLATIGSVLATANSWWGPIFQWLTSWTAAQLGLWLLPIIALCALGSYLSLRWATA